MRRDCVLVVAVFLAGCGSDDRSRGTADREAIPRAARLPVARAVGALQPNVDFNDKHDFAQAQSETYDHIVDNSFVTTDRQPVSTFSIDVDTASYANIRRFLNGGELPPRDAVRIEEMLNYFTYEYPAPQKNVPFSVNIEISACPWNDAHRLARIGMKGREIDRSHRPVSNLVFLIDVSGSMQDAKRLPLVQAGLRMLIEQLGENDRVSIVVYAGASGLALPPTNGDRKEVIRSAIDNLQAGGSTNGGAGVELAYRMATENFIRHGTNRVILCTDGDFNVGVTSRDQLTELVQRNARTGIFLTVLGFGMGNYQDALLEQLADRGNGNYGYVDSTNEAKKIFVDQLQGTLVTIAKDVKLQVEFHPTCVRAFRLLGYENRLLAREDFQNDAKDAGEIGAGHTVTALYELVPTAVVGVSSEPPFSLHLRYKEPAEDESRLLDFPATDAALTLETASPDFRWAAAVAEFGMLLRNSPYKGTAAFPQILELAETAQGADEMGYRREFVQLVRRAASLASGRGPGAG